MRNFNLSQKAEQILCRKHQHPILQLNIKQGIPLGERLICRQCKVLNQPCLYTQTVEEQLNEWLKEEQQIFEKEDKFLENTWCSLDKEVMVFEKILESYIRMMKNKIQNILKKKKQILQNKFNLFREQSPIARIESIFNEIAADSLNANILQNLACFLSEQTIENDTIKLKRKVEVSSFNQLNINPFIVDVVNIFSEVNAKLSCIINHEHTDLQNNIGQLNQTLFDLQHQVQPIKIVEHNNKICSMIISNDNSMIASGDKNGLIILWMLQNQQQIQHFKSSLQIAKMTFSHDNKFLAACYSSQPYEILIFQVINSYNTQPIRLRFHNDIVNKIMFTLDSLYFVSGSSDKTLKICDLGDQSILFQETFPSAIYDCSISSNKKYFSISCQNGLAILMDCQSMPQLKQVWKWQAHQGSATSTTFTPNSQFVLTAFQEIKLWSVSEILNFRKIQKKTEPQPQKIIKGDYIIWSLQISCDGQKLISNDGKIKIWKLDSGELIDSQDYKYERKLLNQQNFAATTDFKQIVTIGEDYKLNISKLN